MRRDPNYLCFIFIGTGVPGSGLPTILHISTRKFPRHAPYQMLVARQPIPTKLERDSRGTGRQTRYLLITHLANRYVGSAIVSSPAEALEAPHMPPVSPSPYGREEAGEGVIRASAVQARRDEPRMRVHVTVYQWRDQILVKKQQD